MNPRHSLDATRGDATLLPMASSIDGKRPRPADTEPNQQPTKKRRQHDRREPFNLDVLTLVCTINEKFAKTTLNIFTEPAFTRGELRNAHHYNYDEFRKWLLETTDTPRERAMCVFLPNLDGENGMHSVHDKWSFGGLLGDIRNGVLTVPCCTKYGWYVRLELLQEDDTVNLLEQAPPAALPVAPPTEDATPDNAPDHVNHEGSNIPPSPRNRPLDSAPQSVIDLTTTEDEAAVAGEEEDAPLATDDVEGPSGTPPLSSFDTVMFKKALQFFQVTEQANLKYQIKGIARLVHMYQLYTTYGLLISPITSGVNGAIVGWDVGFGKTMLMLLYLHIRARLASLWRQVNAEWKNKTAIRRNHLPKQNQPFGARCPSQIKCMVECPCVASSDSRRICETYLTDSPAVIVIPSGLAHGWLKEARAVYGDEKGEGKDNAPITFYTYVASVRDHTSLGSNTSKERWDAVVKDTSGQIIDVSFCDDDTEERIEKFVTSGAGNATDVFLVSSMSVKRLQQKYPKAQGTDTTYFTAGVMIMDEHQQYKGSTEASETIPFTVLREISDAAYHPVTLFTLCGTTLEEGPSAWRAPIKHFEEQWKMFRGKQLQCGNRGVYAATLDSFTAARRQYIGLIRLLASKDKKIADLGPEIDMLIAFFKPIIWTLRQDQLYRGLPFNQLPPCEEVYHYLDPVMDSPTGSAFKSLVTGVQSLIGKKLKVMVDEWEASDKADPKPTMSSLVEDLANGQNRIPGTCFINLQRASMYPYLAVLQDVLDADEFNGNNCQAGVDNCHKQILQGVHPTTALKVLQTWEFTGHLDGIEKNSVKFRQVKKLIHDMVHDQDQQTIPPDKSGKRHAILFHSQPISAVLTYVLLLRDPELRNVVKPLLLCSKSNNEERARIVEQMNEECTPQCPNKVLVTLTSIAAEGFNIQRANNIWFAELPVSLSKKEQAKGRAYRQGQKMKVNIVKLVEKGNLMEEFGYDAMKAKETIAKLVYGVHHKG